MITANFQDNNRSIRDYLPDPKHTEMVPSSSGNMIDYLLTSPSSSTLFYAGTMWCVIPQSAQLGLSHANFTDN